MKEHPFDRYAAFVDLTALKEASARPLRKCLRVNTLKTTVEKVTEWGKEKGWVLTPVPWCAEGLFIDREDRSQALGKDMLQLLGHIYIQEASSMLPPALLGVQPDEMVLDMSAAPGSKTTQMGAMMQNRGLIIANDVQETRLWTLKTAQHRLGVINAVVTKKVGQWFSKHLTERFDAVLCDAPCTAQGTARKDTDALDFSSQENVDKMSRLQIQLLCAAIDVAKVGGRVVYSTCTLTPEENEGVIQYVLNKYGDRIEVLHPGLHLKHDHWIDLCISDSHKVQESLGIEEKFPALRLWPQTCDTEGFFSVLLRKKAPTEYPVEMEDKPRQEHMLPKSKINEISNDLIEMYGTNFLDETDVLIQREEQVLLVSRDAAYMPLPLQNYAMGIPFVKLLNDNRIRVSHEVVTLRGDRATLSKVHVNDEELATLMKGQDIECDPALLGDHLLFYKNICIGRGLAKGGKMKNNLPRTMILS